MPPKVTIGIISYNRFHYLRATLESARECIQYPDLEWMVVDASTETGLREYLDGKDWLETVYLPATATHIDSMNTIVEKASGEYVIIWPDDVQFIVKGPWLADFVEILEKNDFVGCMGIDCVRESTVERHWGRGRRRDWRVFLWELKHRGLRFRRQRLLHSARGLKVATYGWKAPGIVGSGIPSLTKTAIWRALGPWKFTAADDSLVDSSGGGETEMLVRYGKTGMNLHKAAAVIPVAADIVTDRTGTKAKVRGGKRYGEYWKPKNGPYYYRIWNEQDLIEEFGDRKTPLSFKTMVEPIGYEIARDARGERLKNAINDAIVEEV